MRQIFQISLTTLVSLAGIIFACAEGSPLAGITVIVALFALFFIDWQQNFFVSSNVATVLGLIAFAAAGLEFFNGEIESRLLSGGHLIVYLTWVFLLQRKENRHFWWLCALSLLQVAVASVLTNDVWFGGALIAYGFLACWTLSVFQLLRATSEQVTPAVGENQPRLIVGTTRKGISRDVDHSLLNLRFFSTTSFVFCLSLAMTMLFFLLTPRVWIGQYSIYGDSPVTGKALTGFTEEVRLGDMGEILENSEPVASVQLFHHQTNQRFTEAEMLAYLGPEPLFRGACQERYDSGRWSQARFRPQKITESGAEATIRQEIELKPIGVSTLFGYGNIISMKSQGKRQPEIKPYSSVFSCPDRRDDQEVYAYQVLANPGAPDTAASQLRSHWNYRAKYNFTGYLVRQEGLSRQLSQVRQIAQQVVQEASSDADAATRIETYLRDSGEFTYSMKLDIQDPTIDPVEDFLVNRKQGHCEYFASAMALMLRGVNIPARLVTGFKGGFFKDGVMTIQQLHSHSWVEAYIEGQWRTFDPTPGERDESVSELEGARSLLEDMKVNLNSYWNAGVRLSPSQQRDMIYKPVKDAFSNIGITLKDLFQGNVTRLMESLEVLKSPRKWFSLQGGIVAFILLLLLSSLVWCLNKLLKLGIFNRQRNRKQQGSYQQVEFFNRFRKILKSQGLSQTETQTAREFVAESLKKLQPKLNALGLETWPDEIVQKFYQVRFGQQPLSATDAAQVNEKLTQLEHVLVQTDG